MKKVLHLIALLFISVNIFAQAPQKMSYQSVIRNASNALVINAPVKMRISILQGSITGNAVYSELHSVTTNANGLVSIEIGAGSSPIGTFSSINWGSGTYFLKTETDPTNSTNYSIVGTSQLLSVPYALNANCVNSYLSSNGDTLTVGCKKYVIPGIKDVTPPPTINNGLVGYWPFNGNANDESGNGNNGTIKGASLTNDRFGNANKAYNFDGKSYITTPLNSLTGPISLVVWYKNTIAVSGHASMISSRVAPEKLTGIFILNNTIGFDINSGTPTYRTSTTINNPSNNWNNIIITYDNDSTRIYVNGILKIKQKITLTDPVIDAPVWFGFDNFTNAWDNRYWFGLLDDIRIYNRALTQEEITYLANN